MALTVTNNTDTTNVTTGSDHAQVASIKLDKVGDLAARDVQNDSVVDLNNKNEVVINRCFKKDSSRSKFQKHKP